MNHFTIILLFTNTCWLTISALKLYRPSDDWVAESFLEEEVPGIQYLSRGYNIFFGNPHTTGKIDSGISGAIFDLLNCSNGQTYNGYLVPNGVSILPSPTCVQEFTYNAVTGVHSYSSTLQESASVDGKYKIVSFSASRDYQKIYNETNTTKTVYTSTYTQCACYYASLKTPYALPAFDDNFIGAVKNMPLKYTPSDESNLQFFYDFFTKYFGTHYITDITMGGIFGTLSSMKSTSYSQYQSSNLDIATSAKFSTLHASAAAKSMSNSSVTQANQFDSILISKSIFNIGGDLPANNSATAWQRSLSEKPMPMFYKFDQITHLINSLNFPNIKDITQKQSALQAALDDYCQLLATNDTFGKIECSGYPPDPTIPGKSIIKGFYSDKKDSEPVNPYTDGYNCNQGYKPIVYANWLSAPNMHMYQSYYCLNLTMVIDELQYFAGFYEVCTGHNEAKPSGCMIGNVFTGNCSCPPGFTSTQAFSGKTIRPWKPNCGDVSGYTSTVQVFSCYNASVSLDATIIGGTYRISSNEAACGNINNVYTNTKSCPDGFTAYLMGQDCCYTAGNCETVFHNYICLNNIYPV